MLPHRHLLGALALVIATSVGASAGSGDSSHGAVLSGTVSARSGKPIGDAHVTISGHANGAMQAARTKANGAFRLAVPESGKYLVQVSAPGFATARIPEVEIKDLAALELQMSEAVALEALDAEVRPRPDAFQVVEKEESVAARLEDWLAGQASQGWALAMALPMQDGRSLFIFARRSQTISHVLYAGSGVPDSTSIADLIGQHPGRLLVGVHILAGGRYLTIFR